MVNAFRYENGERGNAKKPPFSKSEGPGAVGCDGRLPANIQHAVVTTGTIRAQDCHHAAA